MKRTLLTGLTLAALAAAGTSCFRNDIRIEKIKVPGLAQPPAARVVTDALGLELHWRADSNGRADLRRGIFFFAGGPFLAAPAWRDRVTSALAESGLKVLEYRVRQKPLIVNVNWPDRHVAAIRIDGLNNRMANIAMATLSRLAAGKEPDNIKVDTETETVTVAYDSTRIAIKNLERAIAHVGFAANSTPALLGGADAIPHGWFPDQNFEDWE